MNLNMRKTMATTALVLLFSTNVTLACDQHGAMGFGVFAKGMPMHSQVKDKWTPSPIKMFHPFTKNYQMEQEGSFNIRYSIPADLIDAKMTISSVEGVKLLGDTAIALDDATGTTPVPFEVEKEGSHIITVRIDGKEGDKPVKLVRTIRLRQKA